MKISWFYNGLIVILFLFSPLLNNLSDFAQDNEAFTGSEHSTGSPENQAGSELPAFKNSPCMFALPDGIIEGVDVSCGVLIVPEDRQLSNSASIELSVAIIHSTETGHNADPLVIAQGGPGGSTIDTFAEILLTDSILRKNRDIVLWDQRGTLYSRPSLLCQEFDQLVLDTIELDLTDEQAWTLELNATKACSERLWKQGIDLSAYNSLENAADIDDLRRALGYEQINLYGVSYGTLLALHTMRDYPGALRSVILDAVVPTQINFILDVPQTMDRAFNRLFSVCRNDPACNNEYAELENIFYEVVSNLEVNPAIVPMTDLETFQTYNTVVDGESFLNGLFQMMYIGDLIPALPRMIYDAKNDNFDFFSRIMQIIVFDRTTSYGMYYTVVCSEDGDFQASDQDLTGVNPQIQAFEGDSPEQFLQACELWNLDPLPPYVDEPVVSDIPTLIFSGEFDPITPPEYGEVAAQTLINHYLFTFPGGGHGQAFGNHCADQLIVEFLDDPTRRPQNECATELGPPEFLTPDNLISLPIIGKMLNLDVGAVIEFVAYALSTVALVTSFLILPIFWLIRRSRNQRLKHASTALPFDEMVAPAMSSMNENAQVNIGKQTVWIRLSGWIAAANGAAMIVFMIALVISIGVMVAENDYRLFFGVAGSARIWFILPIMILFLTLAMIIATVQSWKNKTWSLLLRVYYSFLTLSAIVGTFILVKWGAITAIFPT